MSERIYDVKIVGVDYVCDECGTGLMESTGVALMSNPPWYPHHCSHCGATKNISERYPTVRYRPVQEKP